MTESDQHPLHLKLINPSTTIDEALTLLNIYTLEKQSLSFLLQGCKCKSEEEENIQIKEKLKKAFLSLENITGELKT